MSSLIEAARLLRRGRLGSAALKIGREIGREMRRALGRAGLPDPSPTPAPAAAARREAPPTGGRFIAGSFTGETGSREYKLYLPANRGPGPAPLLVMLHGCTQSPDDFAAGTRMNALAEEHGLLVLYPAQAEAYNAQKCWNWFDLASQRRDGGEAALLAGMTRRIVESEGADPSRVYVAGISAGGAMAAILAAAYPDLFAAAGIHSGLPVGAARSIPSALVAMKRGAAGTALPEHRPVPTIVFHGDRDKIVHPSNGEAVMTQALVAATDLRPTVERGSAPGGHPFTRTVYRDPQGRATFELWMVEGAGHAWIGGGPDGSYTDPQGPDASAEMLRFLLEQRCPA